MQLYDRCDISESCRTRGPFSMDRYVLQRYIWTLSLLRIPPIRDDGLRSSRILFLAREVSDEEMAYKLYATKMTPWESFV